MSESVQLCADCVEEMLVERMSAILVQIQTARPHSRLEAVLLSEYRELADDVRVMSRASVIVTRETERWSYAVAEANGTLDEDEFVEF